MTRDQAVALLRARDPRIRIERLFLRQDFQVIDACEAIAEFCYADHADHTVGWLLRHLEYRDFERKFNPDFKE